MINLLDMMVPQRSGSHRGVHAPGGVTYPAVTWNKGRKGTQRRSRKTGSGLVNSFFKATSEFQIIPERSANARHLTRLLHTDQRLMCVFYNESVRRKLSGDWTSSTLTATVNAEKPGRFSDLLSC